MYDFLVVWGGRAQRFFRLLRAEAARLVLTLRAGARRATRPSALGGRINELKDQIRPKAKKAKGGGGGHVPLGVVAGRAWCYA
jgi:hypothetical protein